MLEHSRKWKRDGGYDLIAIVSCPDLSRAEVWERAREMLAYVTHHVEVDFSSTDLSTVPVLVFRVTHNREGNSTEGGGVR